jgi:hypothetical protein
LTSTYSARAKLPDRFDRGSMELLTEMGGSKG